MPLFEHDSIHFHYREAGEGVPFFFQHGLTADVEQPFGLFEPPAGVRMIALDCRAHGLTRPIASDKIGIGPFVDDVVALMDFLRIDRAVIGGTSMGAAMSLNLGLRYPDRVLGLVVSRPAWLEGPMSHNVELYSHIAGLIARHGCEEAQHIFKQSDRYERMLGESPAVAATLLHTFELPDIHRRIVILERIPKDQPYAKLAQLSAIRVPTLVLANHLDPVHPFEVGQAIARAIPGAEFKELTAKSVSADQHKQDVQRYIEEFLSHHFLNRPRPDSSHSGKSLN